MRQTDPPQFDPSKQRDAGWHVEKKIDVAQVIGMLALIGSLFVWINAQDKRIVIVEERTAALMASQKEQDDRLAVLMGQNREEFKALRDELREHNRKLDEYLFKMRNSNRP